MIAHRRGHNFKTVGAEGIVKEVEECNKIHDCVDRQLTSLNVEHINVNPPTMYGPNDVRFTVEEANNIKADFYFSIHMNKYDGKANGVEIIVYDDVELPEAKRTYNNLVGLGFRGRGIKTLDMLDGKNDGIIERSLWELKGTRMNAMIIEVCFCDSPKDVDLYKRIGVERIAKAITEGVTGKSLTQETTDTYYQVVTNSFKNKDNAIKEVEELKKSGHNAFIDIEKR